VGSASTANLRKRLWDLAQENRTIHERECFNLNPAANVMNPRAEAILSESLGSRPSLGYPGSKYEMGLEAVEKIEVIAAELAAEIFDARFAEIRVGSGALANLYAFMATTKPGDRILVPPASVGGHVTHHTSGAAGLYGLEIHQVRANPSAYTVDLDDLRKQAKALHPKLITIGGSLNLLPHPVKEVRAIADEVGALVLFDAAHACGLFAGHQWPNPLAHGAHMMTMSTYKSLGGPAGGLVLTNEASLAERIDHIAFPGLTANFDAAKSASLAISLLDWRDHGRAYARTMVEVAQALAGELAARGLPVFGEDHGFTKSHQLAVLAWPWSGGQAAARKLRKANLLTSGIGLPVDHVNGDMNGLRLGTPEIVRWGVTPADGIILAGFIADALNDEKPETLAPRVAEFRKRFSAIHYVTQ
jgi:glycine hydroxymethyltransferase